MKRRILSVAVVVALLASLVPLAAIAATSANLVEVSIAEAEPEEWTQPGGYNPWWPTGRGGCDGWELQNNYNLHANPVNHNLAIDIAGSAGGTPILASGVPSGTSYLVADASSATTRSLWWRQGSAGWVEFPLTRDLSECHGLAGSVTAVEALFSSQTSASGVLTAAVPEDACESLTATVEDDIVVVVAGACDFATAYENVVAAGAAGVVFVASGDPVVTGGSPSSSPIPAVMVAQATGTAWLTALGAGFTVRALLDPTPTGTLNGPSWPVEGALEASAITQTGLTLTWPDAVDGDGEVVGYRLYGDGEVLSVDAASPFNLTDLTPGTSYEFSVVAYDDLGLDSEPLELTVATAPLTPPYWVDGELFVSSITQTSVLLSWDPAADDDGEVVQYRVEVDGNPVAWLDDTNWNYTVSDLSPGTVYSFAVVAVDDDGLEASLTASASTLIAPVWPGGAELGVSDVTQTSLTLTWPAATDADGTVETYLVHQDGELIATLGGTTLLLAVDGLNPGTTYAFSVTAVDDDGLEATLNTSAATHIAPVWPNEAALTATEVTRTSLTLNWPAATDADGTVVSYRVYQDEVLIGTVDGETLQLEISGLETATSYSFAVVAEDNHGHLTSELSADIETMDWVETTVGAFDPRTGQWHLRDQAGNVTTFYYGNPGDIPIVGDWDCDGVETVGLYRQSTGYAYVRNSNDFGNADRSFYFGKEGDIPLAGDFDGDGCDTVSVYRPSEGRVFITNELPPDGGALSAEFSYWFGNPGDKPFVGDFNGNGQDTIGLHRESTGYVYFRNSHSQGEADEEFYFGNPNDRLVAGDWGLLDGADSPAVFRPGNTTWYFRYTNSMGNADRTFSWGQSHWLPVAGHFGLDSE